MYEYANRLTARGHYVTLLHPIARPYKKTSTPIWLKQLLFALRGVSRPKWFALRKDVVSQIIPSAEAQHVPDADVSICTWWEMAYMLASWPVAKGIKLNLIQDYEIWGGNEALVEQSYSLPLKHICVSRHLQELVARKSGEKPSYLPNAIDPAVFRDTVSPVKRAPHSIIMLYSTEPRKGTVYGLEALEILKKQFTDLEVTLFGVVDPINLPRWIKYHKKPKDLAALFNNHAIFITPSVSEGWGLPSIEAMCCGCAVVCTEIGGHKDYAIHEQTALLVPPESAMEIAKATAQLMVDQNLRLRLSAAGGSYVRKHFNWETNTDDLLELIARVLAITE